MEVQNLKSERVGRDRRRSGVPGLASVGRRPELPGVSDEVGAVVGEGVVRERDEAVFGLVLDPSVTFVGGLPYGVILQAEEKRLREDAVSETR